MTNNTYINKANICKIITHKRWSKEYEHYKLVFKIGDIIQPIGPRYHKLIYNIIHGFNHVPCTTPLYCAHSMYAEMDEYACGTPYKLYTFSELEGWIGDDIKHIERDDEGNIYWKPYMILELSNSERCKIFFDNDSDMLIAKNTIFDSKQSSRLTLLTDYMYLFD